MFFRLNCHSYYYSYCFLRTNNHHLPSPPSLTLLPPNNTYPTPTFSSLLSSLLPYTCTSSFIPIMSLSTSSTPEMEESGSGGAQIVVLCGKSSEEENRTVELKLPEFSPIHLYTLPEFQKASPLPEDAFQVNRFMSLLATECFGRFLLYSPRLSSTQTVVSHNFGALPIGAVCVADTQFQGKGRTSNVWESPKGCLMFSFSLQMENGRILPFIQYVISLALVEAVKAVCQHNGIQNLDVKIKWPNDLYLDGQKVGGILCTSTYRSKRFDVTAGIGLNVANEKPSISLNSVVQRLHSPDQQLMREDILATFFNEFEKFYSIFKSQGFQPFEESYYKTWLHRYTPVNFAAFHLLAPLASSDQTFHDQRVIVQDGDTESVVTIKGITSEGYLLAVGDDGEASQLHPDGNSFDFFKGLVRRKLT